MHQTGVDINFTGCWSEHNYELSTPKRIYKVVSFTLNPELSRCDILGVKGVKSTSETNGKTDVMDLYVHVWHPVQITSCTSFSF